MSVTTEAVVTFPLFYLGIATAVQLGALEIAALTTTHAATTTARAASVILADDPKLYDGAPVGSAIGARLRDVESAASLPLTVITGKPKVHVTLDRSVYREDDDVRVRVDFDYPCNVAMGKWLVCGSKGTYRIHRESVMPYQGAGYDYP